MYSTFDNVNKSLKLAWKYKILWIFALMIGAASSSGSGSNSSSSNNSSNLNAEFNDYVKEHRVTYPKDDQINNFKNMVLGTSDVRKIDSELTNIVAKEPIPNDSLVFDFLNKNAAVVVLGVVSLLILMIVGMIISFLVEGWANTAFLYGLSEGASGRDLDLALLGDIGRKHAKNFIILVIIYFASFFGLFALYILTMIPLVFVKTVPLLVLVPIISSVILILFALNIGFSYVYAIRHLITHNLSPMEAFKAGLSTFRKNIGITFKLIFANCLVQMSLIVSILAVFGGIAVAVVSSGMANSNSPNPVLAIILTVFGLPLFFLFILIVMAVGGFMKTYEGFTWTNLFVFITTGSVGPELASNKNIGLTPPPTPIQSNPMDLANMFPLGGNNAAQ